MVKLQNSAASDLGLHCLPMSLLWDARQKWVNIKTPLQSSGMNYSGTCRGMANINRVTTSQI